MLTSPEPFTVTLSVSRAAEDAWGLWGALVREDERVDLALPPIVLSSGLFVHEDRIHQIDAGEAIDWVFRLRRHGEVRVPTDARDEFLVELASLPNLPDIELPPRYMAGTTDPSFLALHVIETPIALYVFLYRFTREIDPAVDEAIRSTVASFRLTE